MLEQPGFWDDVEHSQQVMKELKNLKDTIEEFETLSNQYEDIGTLIEMAEEENDASLVEEIGNELASFEEKFEEFRIDTLLSEEYDANNAIVTIHAGVGGTEACDWAQMLYRMYTRFAEKKGFSVEVLDYLDGEEAGIKSVTFQVNGLHAYGYLKSEKGVHRLVRISPFNAAGKRQTSFAAVDVMPELDLLYMTRVQKERFFNEEDYIRLRDTYVLDRAKMKLAKEKMIVMHPLPRINEISVDVDRDPRAVYFKQVRNGKDVRKALIATLLRWKEEM
mgnify:CR=1 FL=1